MLLRPRAVLGEGFGEGVGQGGVLAGWVDVGGVVDGLGCGALAEEFDEWLPVLGELAGGWSEHCG